MNRWPGRTPRAVVDGLHLLYSEGLDPDEFMLVPDDSGDEVVIQSTDEDGVDWRTTYGGQDAFECLVRSVLSQNTSDQASQPAHDALVERYGECDGDGHSDGHEQCIEGRGHPDLTFESDRSLVSRTSEYVDDQTVMVDADDAAALVDRAIVEALADGAVLECVLSVDR